MKTAVSKKLSADAKEFILKAIAEIVHDPDFGLHLSARTTKRLREAAAYAGATISAPDIRKKYY